MQEDFKPVDTVIGEVPTTDVPLESAPATETAPEAPAEVAPGVSPDDAKPVGAATIVELDETAGLGAFPEHEENA